MIRSTPSSIRRLLTHRSLSLLAIALVFGLALRSYQTPTEPRFALDSDTVPAAHASPLFESGFASDGITQLVHAPAVAETAEGKLLAVWFAGSREGATDVNIYGATFENGEWSEDRIITSPTLASQSLKRYIKKVGNPVIARGPDDRLWLTFVTVTAGGWATSSINLAISDDHGETWSTPRKLVTSPFLNISTLVKGTPRFYEDGSMALPIYHELIGKFGELLRVSTDGEILSKTRITSGTDSLQPVVLPGATDNAIALLRHSGSIDEREVLLARTDDGGKTWTEATGTGLPNPNAAIAATRLPDGRIMAVANDTAKDRFRLALMVADADGTNWTTVRHLEDDTILHHSGLNADDYGIIMADALADEGAPEDRIAANAEAAVHSQCRRVSCRFQYDYPYLIRSGDTFHLLYTWNKTYIKHTRFNMAWLESQI